MVHAIIFDMDGVLIDSQPMHYLGDQQTLAAHGVDVPVEAMTAYAGTTNQLRFELFKERYHLSETIDSLIADSANGVLAAVRAGMTCLGYQNPTSGEQDLSKANAVIDDFRTIDADFLIHLSEKNDIVH